MSNDHKITYADTYKRLEYEKGVEFTISPEMYAAMYSRIKEDGFKAMRTWVVYMMTKYLELDPDMVSLVRKFQETNVKLSKVQKEKLQMMDRKRKEIEEMFSPDELSSIYDVIGDIDGLRGPNNMGA